jgi:hypothetical protein
MSASPSDILSAIKNIVTALNAQTQATLNINGQTNLTNITTATVLKASAGRVCSVSVITAGSTTGAIYDSAVLGQTTKPLYIVPSGIANTPYIVNLPVNFGILVVPGTGQKLAVSFS